jgi:hypothetical protein
MSEKPRMILVTDPKIIEAIVRAGKYREHLPFWTRAGDALWVEKPVGAVASQSNTGGVG